MKINFGIAPLITNLELRKIKSCTRKRSLGCLGNIFSQFFFNLGVVMG